MMIRTIFSRQSISCLTVAMAIGFHGVASTAIAASPPNILLLLSDDHSYPYLSCYGSRDVRTPTLDRLASEGMKCHRFFTSAPQCVPSRAALMTGRSPVALRMTRFSSPLPKEEVTLPELLRDRAGYYTGICGRSFHLDGPAGSRAPEISGLIDQHRFRTFSQRVDSLNTCGDSEVASQLERFLDGRPQGKPFFMWANFSDPHHPWNGSAELRPDPKTVTLPAHWPDLPGIREEFADYCAEINRLDHTLAKVLTVLRNRQLMETTFILFLGDNGLAFPHGKGSLYDPGSNVPCIARWPGSIPAGGESYELLSGEDVTPTLLEVAGLPPTDRMSGVSFLKMLRGVEHPSRSYLFVERGPHGSSSSVQLDASSASYDLSRAVRSNRYKLIYNGTPWLRYGPVDSAGGPGWKQMVAANAEGKLSPALAGTYFQQPRPVYELYDLKNDPSELNNLSGHSELAEVERELAIALTEKMILDFDYLPLPSIGPKDSQSAQSPARDKKGGKKDKSR